jgi:hypothetical protein
MLCVGVRAQTGAVAPGESPRHPALQELPRTTYTSSGIAGDPIDVALVGTEVQLIRAMVRAGWRPADQITLGSSLRIAASTVFHLSYQRAPVSDLYVWKRKQDLAFEKCVGKDPRRRHHVRFWVSEEVDDSGRPLWIGAATYDNRLEISRTTGFFTHHIAPDVDAERDKLLADLQRAELLERCDWIEHFYKQTQGRNGSGDPYFSDGRLPVGVLVPVVESARR